MTVPYRYIKGAAAGRDETCVLCGSRRTDLVVDHCHTHGYARGLLCGSCNARLAALDAGKVAPTSREAFYLGNCPECRKDESPDSPDACALRIATVALTVASARRLSPRQAAALAFSLTEVELPGSDRKQVFEGEPKIENRKACTAPRLSGESAEAAPRLSPGPVPWTELSLRQAVASADAQIPGLKATELSKALAQVGVNATSDSVRSTRSALRAMQRPGTDGPKN